MNVFKFHILVEAKDSVTSTTREIENTYASKSVNSENYKNYVQQTWMDSKKEKIMTIYPKESLLACCKKSRCTYFVVDVDSNDAIDQATVEVLVLSELNDVNDAYNLVYKDLMKKLHKKFRVSLTETQALLYIYDGSDIVATHVMIKADIVSFSEFRPSEIVRSVILGIIAVGFVITAALSDSTGLDNVMYSLAASSIFFVISEFLIRISNSKIVEIKSFTNWVKTEDRNEIINSQDTDLENPEY